MRHISDTEETILRAAASLLNNIRDRLTILSFDADGTELRRLIIAARDAETAESAVRHALTSFEVRLEDPVVADEPQSLRVQS